MLVVRYNNTRLVSGSGKFRPMKRVCLHNNCSVMWVWESGLHICLLNFLAGKRSALLLRGRW